jgi:hypothetical protein
MITECENCGEWTLGPVCTKCLFHSECDFCGKHAEYPDNLCEDCREDEDERWRKKEESDKKDYWESEAYSAWKERDI